MRSLQWASEGGEFASASAGLTTVANVAIATGSAVLCVKVVLCARDKISE